MKILITGASRGIGLAEAKLLSSQGHQLFLLARTNESFKEEISNSLKFGYDISALSDIDKFIDDLQSKTDSIDVLINNVGMYTPKKFENMSDEDINQLIDVNFRAAALITRKTLPLLRKSQTPQIVFMSSAAAKSSIVGESVYSATKGAVTNFASVLRNEFGGEIKVSTVHSWGVNTWGSDQATLLKPESVAQAVDFIISRDRGFLVESIDVSHPEQWRGSNAPWSPK
jgi:NADP-dependent 3-hydroxy acid dehydrogenase YdfG